MVFVAESSSVSVEFELTIHLILCFSLLSTDDDNPCPSNLYKTFLVALYPASSQQPQSSFTIVSAIKKILVLSKTIAKIHQL